MERRKDASFFDRVPMDDMCEVLVEKSLPFILCVLRKETSIIIDDFGQRTIPLHENSKNS